MSKLFVYPKRGDAFDFDIKKKRVTLGRSADNDIVLRDPFCSGHHAFIFPEDGIFFVQDNNSKNGTFLNGQKLQGSNELEKGDEILVGSTRIVFDKEIATRVEVTDDPSQLANVNTIINLKDIFGKPPKTAAKPTSVAVDVGRLESEQRLFSFISDISKALTLHEPINELLNHIMDLIIKNMPMDRAVLMLKEGNPPQFFTKVFRVNNQNYKDQKIQVSQSIINMAVDQHSALLISDVLSDSRFKAQESIICLNIHSAMCVPLWNNQEIIGIIYSDRVSHQEAFSEDDLKLLTVLANLTATKIEYAKLVIQAIEKEKMEKELQLAAQIQNDFLPSEIPPSGNYEVAGNNIPCHQVGGDYYDIIPIDENRLGIVIADVSGKGVSASLLMASVRAALHAEIHPEYSMHKMVSKLNDFVQKSSPLNSFITFFYCELDEKRDEIKYVNAGHNPPIMIHESGKYNLLKPSGFPLGMFPKKIYEESSIKVKKGDVLFLYTDGITDCRNKQNKEFGEERLKRHLKKNIKLPSMKLLKKVFGELDKFMGDTSPLDDMTLVAVKKKN